nr:hypothetical protein L203_03179 [Cryptococcus depauperatus CBS 7841]
MHLVAVRGHSRWIHLGELLSSQRPSPKTENPSGSWRDVQPGHSTSIPETFPDGVVAIDACARDLQVGDAARCVLDGSKNKRGERADLRGKCPSITCQAMHRQ